MTSNTAGEWFVWTHNSPLENPNDCWSVGGPEVRDNKKMRGYSREHAYLISAASDMRAALIVMLAAVDHGILGPHHLNIGYAAVRKANGHPVTTDPETRSTVADETINR